MTDKKTSSKDPLTCDIDGNCLCIVKTDFINLAESPAVFVELTDEQIKKIQQLRKEENDTI